MHSQKADRDALQRAFRARRHVLGLTQDDVARRANTSKSTVSRFESAKSEPEPETLDRMLTAINATVPELERLAAAAGPADGAGGTPPGPLPVDLEPADVPPGLASASPDQLLEYMHALIATIRFRHPEHLARLATVLSQAHDRILRPQNGAPPR